MQRVVLIVLDGLGIGAMPDVPLVRPEDVGASTLRSILKYRGHLTVPTLARLGLSHASGIPEIGDLSSSPVASYGKCMLRHHGADTYMGHQEIMGSAPRLPECGFMDEVGSVIASALRQRGFQVQQPRRNEPWLLVEGRIVVADNMEGEPGQNINVTASLDEVSFEEIRRVGMVVREVVRVGRVILVGGTGMSLRDVLEHMVTRGRGTGVDTPGLGVYERPFRVEHLGYGINPEGQAPTIFVRAGYPVVLIGKMADIIACQGAVRFPAIPTAMVFDHLAQALDSIKRGLIAVNVQETDLAGHAEDPGRFAEVLELCDLRLGQVIRKLRDGDLLIVVGDHGNDPSVGHPKHTREFTPLLVYTTAQVGRPLGTRATLADVGATIVDAVGLERTESGQSFFSLIRAA
ncbi:MAG: phosphopentomutase [Bacillota bacterium]